jgi:hypothetical protein
VENTLNICRIVVDQKEIYWIGASLKDAGRLTFAAAKMGAEVIPGLLEPIRKATMERKEYGTEKKSVRRLNAGAEYENKE